MPAVTAAMTGVTLSWREWLQFARDPGPGREAPDILKMVKIIDRSIEPGLVEGEISEIVHLLKKIDQNVQNICEQTEGK